jgi:hypothetical protein
MLFHDGGNQSAPPGITALKLLEHRMPTPITYRGGSISSARCKGGQPDAVTLLKHDHKLVADLFERYEASGEDRERKTPIAGRICQ